MADKLVTVRPSGGTYTSIDAAITGELLANADLTTLDGILTIRREGNWTTAETSRVFLNGFTRPTATRYVIIEDISTGNNVLEIDYAGRAVDLRVQYTRVKGLLVHNTNALGVGFGLSVAHCGIDSCATFGGLDAIRLTNNANLPYYIRNHFSVGHTRYGIAGNQDPLAAYISNSVFVGGTHGIYADYGETYNIRNCYFGNTSTADLYVTSSGAINITTSRTEDGSRSTSTVPYSTATFVNVTPGSEDFHLASGSGLIDIGTNLTSDIYDPFDWDREGTERTGTWDAGPYAYVSSGGVSGTSSGTQARQTGTGTGVVSEVPSVSGTSSGTQARQTGTGTGVVSEVPSVSGTSSGTQSRQMGTGAGSINIPQEVSFALRSSTDRAGLFTLSSTEDRQNASPDISGTSSGTQARQTGTGSGVVAAVPSVSGTSSGTQARQTGTGTGTITAAASISGTSSGTQARQTGTGAGNISSIPAVFGSSDGTQSRQTGSGAGTVAGPTAVLGTSSGGQSAQFGSCFGVVIGIPVVGLSDGTQSRQTGAGAGVVAEPGVIIGSAAGQQSRQQGAGEGLVITYITGMSEGSQERQEGTGRGFVREPGTSLCRTLIQGSWRLVSRSYIIESGQWVPHML